MQRIGHLGGKVGNYGTGMPVGHVLREYDCHGQNREIQKKVVSNPHNIGHRQNDHERDWCDHHLYPENHHREESRHGQYDCR